MDALGYGRDGIWGRDSLPGESNWTTTGQALGAAGMAVFVPLVVAGGHALDELNHFPGELGHIGEEVSSEMNNAPSIPLPPPSTSPPDGGAPSSEPASASPPDASTGGS